VFYLMFEVLAAGVC